MNVVELGREEVFSQLMGFNWYKILQNKREALKKAEKELRAATSAAEEAKKAADAAHTKVRARTSSTCSATA